MQEFELTGIVDEQGHITLDKPLIHCKNKRVRAVFVVSEDSFDSSLEDADWEHLSTEEFFRGYSEADAIYDEEL
ncbi:hypothetical protein [Dactylococcopsis salina]|uniref:Uncharacterized protein n=1 Tax=Dactylococcopsis salina (strain PCC 8305) TaxID=13035 RepID=K9YUT0_DACS8|nr:hypothetical protein [Dactylococcopsis salina]AFZ49873.1 hypothetical protein Dacsa_1171 [Dactylococcopsis salina PCC 8305]